MACSRTLAYKHLSTQSRSQATYFTNQATLFTNTLRYERARKTDKSKDTVRRASDQVKNYTNAVSEAVKRNEKNQE